MKVNNETSTLPATFVGLLTLVNVVIIKNAFVANPRGYWYLCFTLPLMIVALFAARPHGSKPLLPPFVHRIYEGLRQKLFNRRSDAHAQHQNIKRKYTRKSFPVNHINSHFN